MYQVKSPILFLIFNRPKETQFLFNAIKLAKPKKLYVAADGPRNNGKDELVCKETKSILDQVDWECELITLFRKENLGCKKAVSEAVTWFFENEEEGIILEDDCLPSPDFFRFCDIQLERYRDDERVGHLCGCNFQDGIKRGEGDYYYSKLTHVWGWASWRRVWGKYDLNMNGLEKAKENDILSSLTDNEFNKKSIYEAFLRTKRGEINTWDYQYFFSNMVNGRLSIIPNYNLISNIGFNEDGTHTFDSNSPMSNVAFSELPIELVHPKFTYQNRIADKYTLEKEMPSLTEIRKNKVRKLIKDILINLKLYQQKNKN
ncbi:nucleotide-diphospho-sugar transferase [Flavobacterium gawalongense]|uniref:Nucleotide-diphospho-sugar transferase n=1 Tax=Flavobacterium gawalongense TaxID=2594432 RepID=A0A553BYJ1_9FLAO|nr:nucleotide-diphospho-sugar transferase [Flavobacterium gawalongense]TRX13390.1 nucleotide-diphospho-sugar transferase [Flavobacterium gawalongense]TRX15680.1 nucleotide-diphospho-sugar transferase [Flavobacterium gawalongense]TRX31518.1 nucleotide-diphospho-sugar transferase [Flavobacterium gawalongense]